MAYLNAYLEPCPGYGWEGGPSFSTRIVSMANGRERRNAIWANARHSYTAPFLNISREAYRQIKQMHLVCRGQLHCFRFRDALDYTATNDVFDIGDGTKTTFQISKFSTIDGITYQRNVYALVSVSVTVNGEEADPTINMNNGEVSFASPPESGAVLRWSGVFDIWVRFNQDDLPFTLDNPNATNGQVTLIEVPAPDEVTS